MTEKRVTLYGDEAEWFESIQDDIAAERNGVKPSNAETVRLLMQAWDSNDGIPVIQG